MGAQLMCLRHSWSQQLTPRACVQISAFDPIAVCGPGADPVPVEAGPFAWLGVAAMTLLPCLF